MARKAQQPKITVISYVRRQNGEKVLFEDLTPEERRKAATQINLIWFNALYKGVAVFHAAEPEAAP